MRPKKQDLTTQEFLEPLLVNIHGDKANAILAACGHNLRLILAFLLFFLKKFSADMAKILENLLAGVFLKEKHAKIYV